LYNPLLTGLWGGTDDSWNGTPVLALGTHKNTDRYPLFIADLDGSTRVGTGKTTSFVFTGGRVADNGIAADSIGFYARENGATSEVGLLTFSKVSRNLFSHSDGSGVWQLSDTVSALKMDDIESPVIGSPYFMSASFDGISSPAVPNEYNSGDAITIISGVVRGNSVASQDWGIWQIIAGGSHPYSETTIPATPVNTAWTIDSYDPTGSPIIDTTFYQVTETVWDKTAKTIDGQAAIAFVNWADAKTYVGGGSIKGVFDPTAEIVKTWQAITTGTGIETGKFLQMAAGATTTETANAALKALNIPAVQVGKATLSQVNPTMEVNGLTNVNMANVTFFANSTGGTPHIWATNAVTGNYNQTTPPVAGGTAATLSGGGLTADFGVRNWNAGKWGANITNGTGTLSGGTYNGAVQFKGGAAGTFGSGTLTTGTAAGIVK
jgi:hypothetical protein